MSPTTETSVWWIDALGKGIAAGPNGEVHLTSANHIYTFKADCTRIKDMAFPITSIHYTSVGVIFSTLT